MEFLVSWLADYVSLKGEFDLEVDAKGRHALRSITNSTLNATIALSERLTSLGLAVEGNRVHPFHAGQETSLWRDEVLLDIDVTSNRPDAMCHLGIARELAVALGEPLRPPDIPFYESLSSDGTGGKLILEDPEGCPRYVARVIRGLKVGPSPEWLRRRLEAIGSRSINNVVDATNYVLWEMGQPLHAFDLATIPGGELRVRRAGAGERLTTLDGKERTLDPEILVIADGQRAIALAGVMGGLDTEVTATTTDVLLESAYFDRRRIRVGAKRLGLHSDASHRFERGADFEICDAASRRCAALLVELAGGRIEAPAVDAVARRPEPVRWRLAAPRLAGFVGLEIEPEEIVRILSGLGFAPAAAGEGAWSGTVPSWREPDFEPRREASERLAYPQDLFEEVVRHVGFDRIPASLPALGGVDPGAQAGHERALAVRRLLAGIGYAEAIHFAFHERAWDAAYPAIERAGEPLALANPLSERFAVLRRSLVPNLAAAAEANARRGAGGVRLFELGHLFLGGVAAELEAVAWVAGGESGEPWDRQSAADLLAVKGIAEELFERLQVAGAAARPAELPGVVPGTGALWRGRGGETLGWFGRLAAVEAPFPLHAGEIALDRLELTPERPAVIAPPRLPGITADLTLTHPLALAWAELAAALRERLRPPLVGFRLKERYRGAGIPENAVATTVTLDYHGGERTLTQDEVNALQSELAADLERRFAAAPPEER